MKTFDTRADHKNVIALPNVVDIFRYIKFILYNKHHFDIREKIFYELYIIIYNYPYILKFI